jgi:hypothetical protein
MGKGDTQNLVPTSADFDDSTEVTLEEVDGKKAKRIGNPVTLFADHHPAAQPAECKTSGAHYQLYYQIIP